LTVSVGCVGIFAVRDLGIADAVGDDEPIPPRVLHRASERQIVCGVAERFGVRESHRIDGAGGPDSACAPYLAGRAGARGAVAPARSVSSRCPEVDSECTSCKPSPGRTAMAIYPDPQQIETLLAGPADRPVVMVNLLRFKHRADGMDEGVSGEEAYRRYAEAMRAFVESKGGRFLWVGR